MGNITTKQGDVIIVPDGQKAVRNREGNIEFVEKYPEIAHKIRTLDDAVKALGKDNILVRELLSAEDSEIVVSDTIAFLRLRVVCAALNERWQPQFTLEEKTYNPWFIMLPNEEYDKLTEENKKQYTVTKDGHRYGFGGVVTNKEASTNHPTANGKSLTFKSEELAEYAGKYFLSEWLEYVYYDRDIKKRAKKTTVVTSSQKQEAVPLSKRMNGIARLLSYTLLVTFVSFIMGILFGVECYYLGWHPIVCLFMAFIAMVFGDILGYAIIKVLGRLFNTLVVAKKQEQKEKNTDKGNLWQKIRKTKDNLWQKVKDKLSKCEQAIFNG